MKRPTVVVSTSKADDVTLIAARVSRSLEVPIEVKVNPWVPDDVAYLFDADALGELPIVRLELPLFAEPNWEQLRPRPIIWPVA